MRIYRFRSTYRNIALAITVRRGNALLKVVVFTLYFCSEIKLTKIFFQKEKGEANVKEIITEVMS